MLSPLPSHPASAACSNKERNDRYMFSLGWIRGPILMPDVAQFIVWSEWWHRLLPRPSRSTTSLSDLCAYSCFQGFLSDDSPPSLPSAPGSPRPPSACTFSRHCCRPQSPPPVETSVRITRRFVACHHSRPPLAPQKPLSHPPCSTKIGTRMSAMRHREQIISPGSLK